LENITMSDNILDQLVTMSNHLGDPALDYAILGEGNTSARADAGTFWVKASGTELRTVGREGFVRISFERALALLNATELTDAELTQGVADARVDSAIGVGPAPDDGLRPSTETAFHAVCLSLEGVDFVGHTHPTAINAIACSQRFEEAVSGRLTPAEVMICGPASAIVPYAHPGVPLARAVRASVEQYVDEHHELPKMMLLQNHGLVALGRNPQEVQAITAMAVNAARVLVGTYALGGPRYLEPKSVKRL
jgi:rhamnose utilization protein RhaD (predicted bifunctional aldolase and dehydrogenase)